MRKLKLGDVHWVPWAEIADTRVADRAADVIGSRRLRDLAANEYGIATNENGTDFVVMARPSGADVSGISDDAELDGDFCADCDDTARGDAARCLVCDGLICVSCQDDHEFTCSRWEV